MASEERVWGKLWVQPTVPDSADASLIVGSLWSDSNAAGGALYVCTSLSPITFQNITGGGSATVSWGDILGTLSNQTDLQTVLDTKQPLDADLTAIAALTTTTFGRSILTQADAPTARTTLEVNAINLGLVEDIPLNGTFTIIPYATTEFRINTLKQAKLTSGSMTFALLINSTPVGGLSAVSITSTPGDTTATSAYDVAVGDRLDITYSDVADAVKLTATILATRL